MIKSVTTVFSLLLAGFAFAGSPAPAPAIPAAQRFHGGGPSTAKSLHGSASSASGNTETYDFTNWAGAFLNHSDVTGVTGTFIVPNPTSGPGGNASMYFCGCAWIGLDGISIFCPNGGLIQAGVNWCVSEEEGPSFVAWYEWWPAEEQQFWDNVNVTAGDSITVNVIATSKSSGEATLINNSNGQIATHTWTGETPELCEVDAEWVVEDYTLGYSLVNFADYGSVTFTDNSAVIDGVPTTDLSDAYLIDMVSQTNSSDVISRSSIEGNDVTCVYQQQ